MIDGHTGEYKGYSGKFRYYAEEMRFHGRVSDIDDIVSFVGKTLEETLREFKNSVDDYIEMCREESEDYLEEKRYDWS